MKQKTLRVFEVDNFENLKKVIDSKLPLVKNHFFMLKEKNKEIEDFLKEKNLKFFILNDECFSSESLKIIEKEKVVIKEPTTKIYDKIIRSGEEIIGVGNFVFLQRINAGAKIEVKGNVEILDENQGLVIVTGEYMVIKKNKGTIIFNEEEIGEVERLTIFTEKFKKVIE